MPAIKRSSLVVYTTIILLALILYYASLSALSQLRSYPALRILEKPFGTELDPMQSDLHREALDHIEIASANDRMNSRFWQMTGDIWLRLGRADPAASKEHYARGMTAFRRAIEVDPANAVLWGRLLAAKTALAQIDDEYAVIYAKAFEYGQRDYRVVKTLVKLGFSAWGNMPVSTRLLQKEAVRALYGKSPMETILIAREHNHVYMTCLWVRDMQLADGYCIHELKKVP